MGKQTKRLARNTFEPLPLGLIRSAGWLLRQLQLQADRLTGHLDEFWPDVANSGWIGGTVEGWERGPYWLDGLVPCWCDGDRSRRENWDDCIFTGRFTGGYRWFTDGIGTLIEDNATREWRSTFVDRNLGRRGNEEPGGA